MLNNSIKAVFCFALLVLTSCTQQVNDLDEARIWFATNQNHLVRMKEILLSHPSIRRVDGERGALRLRQYGEFSEQDDMVYDDLFQQFEELGIEHAVVSKFMTSNERELIVVSYTLCGIRLGGGPIFIAEFITHTKYIDNAKKAGFKFYPQIGRASCRERVYAPV